MVSTNAEVQLVGGKAVHLATESGASITIENGNITVACPGQITVLAGKKSFAAGAHLSREMNSWQQGNFHREWQITSPQGEPLPALEYEIHRADGAVIRGRTDDEGKIPRQQGASFENIKLRVLGPPSNGVKDD